MIEARPNPKKSGLAEEVLCLIGKLYAIEGCARDNQYTTDQIHQLRQEKSKPILNDIKTWLDHTADRTPPKGLLGKAVHYALNNWDRLIRYIEDGRLHIDNNLIENAIRPFALGRKNWLFAGSPEGAKATGILFSLIETAKANGHKPYFYLRYLFEHLPLAKTREDYKNLLPQFVDPAITIAIPA